MLDQNKQSKPWLPVLFWALTILGLGVIFYLSSQTGEESSAVSGGLTQKLIRLLSLQADPAAADAIVREIAHGTEYTVLAILLTLSISAMGWRHPVHQAHFLCMILSVLDEIHQIFVPGRSFQVQDIAMDIAGACVGLFIFSAVRRIIRKRKQRERYGI